MRNAAIMVASLVVVVLALQAMDASRKDRLGTGDQTHNQNLRPNVDVAQVDIGQGDPGGTLTDEQRTLKAKFPALFETPGQIVSFKATWCGPCKKQHFQLKALEREYTVLVYDIDTDEGRALYDHFEGNAVPLTLIVEGGKVKKRFEGYASATTIEQFSLPARKVKHGTTGSVEDGTACPGRNRTVADSPR